MKLSELLALSSSTQDIDVTGVVVGLEMPNKRYGKQIIMVESCAC